MDYVPGTPIFTNIKFFFIFFNNLNVLMFYNSESVKIFGPEIDTF
jgi:hypothetical protein